jgi:hypothetical protein
VEGKSFGVGSTLHALQLVQFAKDPNLSGKIGNVLKAVVLTVYLINTQH